MRSIVIWGLALCAAVSVRGQHLRAPRDAVYLAFYGGVSAHFTDFQSTDPALGAAYSFAQFSWNAALSIRLDHRRTFLHLETTAHPLFAGFTFLDRAQPNRFRISQVGQFGVGISQRLDLIRDRLFFAPQIGGNILHFARRNDPGPFVKTYFADGQRFDQYVFLAPAGGRFSTSVYAALRLTYVLPNGMLVSLRAMYHYGLSPQVLGETGYVIYPSNFSRLSQFTSRGSQLPLQIGIAYPISRPFHKRKDSQ
ncbi:MAG: hypothetical protein AAGN35_05620 [Bacteroidota bacterium]